MRGLVTAAILVFLVIFAAYLALELLPSEYFGGVDRVRIVSANIESLGSEAWSFARPLLQLIVVLAILEWVLGRLGIKLDLGRLDLSRDIRSLLAIMVVIGFSLAALSGSLGSGALKDVCLVVLGFYFGGLSKATTVSSEE